MVPKLPIENQGVQAYLPHRYPFLFVDRVTAIIPNRSIIATKLVSCSEPALQGHFPGNPIYPGVLLIEGMAQASGILGQFSSASGYQHVLLTEVNQCRFRRMILPGDQLEYRIEVAKARKPFYWFNGETYVDGELAAKAQFSAQLT